MAEVRSGRTDQRDCGSAASACWPVSSTGFSPGRQLVVADLAEHLSDQFHRQADDVGFAAGDDVDPSEAVLVTKCPGLVLPATAGEVVVQSGVSQEVHAERGDGNTRGGGERLRSGDFRGYLGRLPCHRDEAAAMQPVAGRGAAPTPGDPVGRGYLLTSSDTDAELSALTAAARSYAKHFREEFGRAHDHFRLIGQDNFRRYVPIREVRVRVHRDDSLFEIVARIIAAKTAGCRVTVSSSPHDDLSVVHHLDALTHSWAAAIEFVEETDDELAERIRTRQTDRLRYAAPQRVPRVVREAAPEVQLYIADAPVLRHGRIELLWYFLEQSLCVDYHRYGNVGARSGEERSETL